MIRQADPEGGTDLPRHSIVGSMDKDILENFLSIPGVSGIALLGRKTRPYFHRSFQDLEKRQQDALIQGLFQVLDSMPSGFDYFDFQFAQQRVFVYPLPQDGVLLVAVDEALSLPVYTQAVNKLRDFLMTDTQRALATFRLFASQHTAPVSTQPQAATPLAPTLAEILPALNRLCQATTSYLGRAVIVNYWKVARQDLLEQSPQASWLELFQVERTAEIHYLGDEQILSPEQHQLLRDWVAAFLKRCEEVIRNFRSLLRTGELQPEDWKLLF